LYRKSIGFEKKILCQTTKQAKKNIWGIDNNE
jgi:hypothetical protein